MQFALLVYETAADLAARSDPKTVQAHMAAYYHYSEALRQAGASVGAAGLLPPSSASHVAPASRLVVSSPPHDQAARAAIELAARSAYGRLLATVAATWGDISAAEDALADAFAAALRTWPTNGVPEKPDAWLIATARRRLIDHARQVAVRTRLTADVVTTTETWLTAAQSMQSPFSDDRLALLFVCAHPAITPEARTPLMLQTVLGLDAVRIASAFALPPATVSQRLVRAKIRIRDLRISFQIPESRDWPARLPAVLDAIYAAYGTGWDEIHGGNTVIRGLAEEAVWLCRTLLGFCPEEPEVQGLLALMLHCEARREARRDASDNYVPLSQ